MAEGSDWPSHFFSLVAPLYERRKTPIAGQRYSGAPVGNYGEVDVSSGNPAITSTLNGSRVIQFVLRLAF